MQYDYTHIVITSPQMDMYNMHSKEAEAAIFSMCIAIPFAIVWSDQPHDHITSYRLQ